MYVIAHYEHSELQLLRQQVHDVPVDVPVSLSTVQSIPAEKIDTDI